MHKSLITLLWRKGGFLELGQEIGWLKILWELYNLLLCSILWGLFHGLLKAKPRVDGASRDLVGPLSICPVQLR